MSTQSQSSGRLFTIAKIFWPGLDEMSGHERIFSIADITGVLYATPLAVAGLIWLIAVTDLTLIYAKWPTFLLLFLLLFVFEQLNFFIFFEITPGNYADWVWSLWSVVTWSAALTFGPTALWITVLWRMITFAQKLWRATTTDWRWNLMRHLALDMAGVTLAALIALSFYSHRSNNAFETYPLPGMSGYDVLSAFSATLIWLLLSALPWVPLLGYFSSVKEFAWTKSTLETFLRYLGITMGWRLCVDPFAILAAGLYIQNGLMSYLFFTLGLLLTSFLAHQLSQAVERSNLRLRELEKLQHLERAIGNMPPDASTLTEVLGQNLRNMFPYCHIEIRIFPTNTLLHHPHDWPTVPDEVWEWLKTQESAQYFMPGQRTPWDEKLVDKALVTAPIIHMDRVGKSAIAPIGGIYLARYRDLGDIMSLLPALQSLGAQIASALRRAEIYAQTLAHQQVEQELALAGKIQASFLPHVIPQVDGWDLTAHLESARQTSGDFFDIIPLSQGQLALVVADVADKGMGAALYMALSRTLLRTYALEYCDSPQIVMSITNHRILTDTQVGMFVTVFYGVLDPATGVFTYCNAGHNPAYMLKRNNTPAIQRLGKTGMALGVSEDVIWKQRTLHFDPGDTLILYTDGITEAQNETEQFFGKQRLTRLVRANAEKSPQKIQAAILEAVHEFAGDRLQFDDVTLMVVRRSTEHVPTSPASKRS